MDLGKTLPMRRLAVARIAPLLKVAALVSLLLVARAAGAQGTPDDTTAQPGQADTIVVRGRRPFDERFNSTASTLTVSRQDIEAMGANSIGDILKQLPGVQVTTNANGGLEIRMRGMAAQNTRILIDGAPVSSTRRDVQLPLDELPADLIDRVEVMRSPTAQYEGAAGGTINIVLKQAQARRETYLWLIDQHVWAKDALVGFISQSGPLGAAKPASNADRTPAPDEPRWTYFVSLTGGLRNLGSDAERTSSTTASPTSSGQTQEQARLRNQNWTLIPRLTGRISANNQVHVRSLFSQLMQDGSTTAAGTGTSGADPTRVDVRTPWQYDRSAGQLAVDWTSRFAGLKLDTSVSYERSRSNYRFDRDSTSSSGVVTTTRAASLNDDRFERVWLANSKLMGTAGATIWTTGIELDQRSMKVDSRSTLDATASDYELAASIRRAALWGQFEQPVDAWKTTMTFGLRAQLYLIEADQRADRLDYRKLYWQPTVNTRTRLAEDTQLRWNLARTVRVPRIWELIERPVPTATVNTPSSPDYAGNASLRPQSTTSLDVGIDQRWATQSQAGVNLFVRNQSDVIARRLTVVSGRWAEQPDNVGDALVWGLESDFRTPAAWLGPRWQVSGNASLLQSRMRGGDTAGSRIPGQARYLANVSLVNPLRASGGWYGGGTLALVGAAELNQPSAQGATVRGREGSHAQLDLYIGSVLPNLGFWRLNVYNITDFARDQRRVIIDENGIVYADQSVRRLTPRWFLTVGTRF